MDLNDLIDGIDQQIREYTEQGGYRGRILNISALPQSQPHSSLENRAMKDFIYVHDKFTNLAIAHRNAVLRAAHGQPNALRALNDPIKALEVEAVIVADKLALQLLNTAKVVDGLVAQAQNIISQTPQSNLTQQLTDACDQLTYNHKILVNMARKWSDGKLETIQTQGDLITELHQKRLNYQEALAKVKNLIDRCNSPKSSCNIF